MLKYNISILFSIFIIINAQKEVKQDFKNEGVREFHKRTNLAKPILDPTDPVPDGSAVDPQILEEYLANPVEPIKMPPPILIEEEVTYNFTGVVNVGDRVGGSDVATLWQYMALVYDDYRKQVAGPAAIINAKWALSSTWIQAIENVPAADLRLYTDVRSGDAAQLSAGKKYRVREIKYHPLKFSYYSTMMLMRCCPTFTSFVTLPSAGKTYNIGYMADFMNYVPTQMYNRKAFADFCECETQPGWDPVRSICLRESTTNYNAANEKGSLLFVDYVFAGINLWPTSNGGEPYTDISKYLQWLSDTAVL